MDRWQPDIVVPTCEEVFYLAAVRDIAGVPLPLFAPPLDLLAKMHDKHAFAGLAQGFGADPPATLLLACAADVAALGPHPGDLVVKPVWSRFGARTLVRPGPETLAALRPTSTDPWVAQTYLPGEEICACAVAIAGEVRAGQAYRPLWRAGLGAGVAFEPVDDAALTGFVRAVCAAMNWTGQIAFDFRRDAGGTLHVIECNPRPTSGVHFFGIDDGLVDAILGRGHAEASETRPMTLPLAMVTYGLAQAVSGRRIGDWLRDVRAMDDIAAWPGDGHLIAAQVVTLAEMVGIALRRHKGLRAASTDDIDGTGVGFGGRTDGLSFIAFIALNLIGVTSRQETLDATQPSRSRPSFGLDVALAARAPRHCCRPRFQYARSTAYRDSFAYGHLKETRSATLSRWFRSKPKSRRSKPLIF